MPQRMMGIEVTAYDDIVGVGVEDLLEWKIVTLLTAGGRRDVDVAEDEVLGPAFDGYTLVLDVGVGFYHRRSGDIVKGDIFTN